jgi:hypothetical protein
MITPPLSWTGKTDKLEDVQMYMPLMISVRPLIEKLAFSFDNFDLEYGIVISQILKDIISDDSDMYSSKAENALKLILPLEKIDEVGNSLVLHECRMLLTDAVTEFIPTDCTDKTFPYYYPSGDMFILYVPTDPNSIADPKLRAKLVPYMALRYLDY